MPVMLLPGTSLAETKHTNPGTLWASDASTELRKEGERVLFLIFSLCKRLWDSNTNSGLSPSSLAMPRECHVRPWQKAKHIRLKSFGICMKMLILTVRLITSLLLQTMSYIFSLRHIWTWSNCHVYKRFFDDKLVLVMLCFHCLLSCHDSCHEGKNSLSIHKYEILVQTCIICHGWVREKLLRINHKEASGFLRGCKRSDAQKDKNLRERLSLVISKRGI